MIALLMSDLDETGIPILEQCISCGKKITQSKIHQHQKQCGKKLDNRPESKEQYRVNEVNDKPRKLSNFYRNYPSRIEVVS